MKDSFVFHAEWLELFEEAELTGDEIAGMIRAVTLYATAGAEPEFTDRLMKSVFATIRRLVDIDNTAYEVRCQKNRENGKKGGRPKKTQENPSVILETQENPSVILETEQNPTEPKKPHPHPQPHTDTHIYKSSLDYAPDREEVKAYWEEKGYESNPDRFWNFYNDKNWYKGKKDWKSLADEWEKREHTPKTKPKIPALNYQMRDYNYDSLESALLAR